jgi:hypothetical protein
VYLAGYLFCVQTHLYYDYHYLLYNTLLVYLLLHYYGIDRHAFSFGTKQSRLAQCKDGGAVPVDV